MTIRRRLADRGTRRRIELAAVVALTAGAATIGAQVASPRGEGPRFPDILLVTIDTLRADRLSASGYPRSTSPNLDRLIASGFSFSNAQTVEPLTNPSLASILTSLPPHVHGGTRNGLPVRSGLATLPAVLARRGYHTAAFLGNWTLKPKLSGLDDAWQTYEVVVSRKRWFGLLKSEATARDLSVAALAWVENLRREEPGRPFFLWIHYVEPHAPYRFHEEFARRLGLEEGNASASDRYDTEIAAVDEEVGNVLRALDEDDSARDRLTIFAVDHGEAFGEDGEHGHGRVLHAATLRVPLALSGARVPVGRSNAAVTLLDVAPTTLGLLGLPAHPQFRGRDLGAVLRGEDLEPTSVCVQAHKGAVQSVQRAQRARRAGLLEVGLVADGTLETLRLQDQRHRTVPFGADARAGEGARSFGAETEVSPGLRACLDEILAGLRAADRFQPPDLDPEEIERLRALGYID